LCSIDPPCVGGTRPSLGWPAVVPAVGRTLRSMPPEGGRCSRWNDEKGFGFIVAHSTQESIYVHRTGLVGVDALAEGDEVQFERFQDAIDVKRGKERATNVHLLSRSADGGSSGSSAMRHEQSDRGSQGRTNGSSGGFSSTGFSAPGFSASGGVGREARPYGHDAYRPEDQPPARQYSSGRVEVGSVKSWNDEKKFGFIIPDRGGESIYVHCTGLSGMEYLREGDTVEFERFQDPHDLKRGKERAVNVRLMGDSFSKTVSSVGSTVYGYSRQEVRTPPPPKPIIDTGRVSRWNDDKGFGFIVNHKTQESTYVHRTGLLGGTTVQEGDEVEYERFQDARDMERGKDRCINVRVLPKGKSNTSSGSLGFGGYGRDDFGLARGGGFGRDDQMYGRADAAFGRADFSYSRAEPYAQAPPPAPPPAGAYPMREAGTVLSWNDEKGFGFILVQGSKESIYMHRTGILGALSVQEGDTVEFDRTQDQRDMERGKERAINVQVVSGGAEYGGGALDFQPQYEASFSRVGSMPQDYGAYDPGLAMGSYGQESHSFGHSDRKSGNKGAAEGYEFGTVSAWHDDKGFGFIVCDATQESIYVHRTGLLGFEALQDGDKVEFGRTQDARDVERGKYRACNVRIVSGGGGGGGRGRDRSRSPRRR